MRVPDFVVPLVRISFGKENIMQKFLLALLGMVINIVSSAMLRRLEDETLEEKAEALDRDVVMTTAALINQGIDAAPGIPSIVKSFLKNPQLIAKVAHLVEDAAEKNIRAAFELVDMKIGTAPKN